MKQILITLLAFLAFANAQADLFGFKMLTKKSEVLKNLELQEVEYLASGKLVMLENWKVGEFNLAVDLEFDSEDKLVKIYAQSDEITSSSAELIIPDCFRKINRALQDEFGLPESRKNLDLAKTPQIEMHLLREWKKDDLHIELGLLHLEDVFAVNLKMTHQ